ncbi:MAG TPA: hypothetical protein VKA50_06545 [Gammaproteobacteria bacterium]|nr:hypothetical protein [Gammaproteobacteria bacterium]
MKSISITTAALAAILGAAPVVWAVAATPAAPTNAELRRQSAAMMKADERRREEIHKANMALLKRHDRLMDREERMMARVEAAEKRREAEVERFDKILSTWERQQAEYQKYLDSLKAR